MYNEDTPYTVCHQQKQLFDWSIGKLPFDPIDGLLIPQQTKDKVDLANRSYLSSVIGLAFRKLDVFGYYKFVTAAKNINLLPNRKSMVQQKKK